MPTYTVPWYIGPAPVEPWPDEAPEDWPEDAEWPPPPVEPAQLCQPGALDEEGNIVWHPLPGGLTTKTFDLDARTGRVQSKGVVKIPGWKET
jgi:hypothetical protein